MSPERARERERERERSTASETRLVSRAHTERERGYGKRAFCRSEIRRNKTHVLGDARENVPRFPPDIRSRSRDERVSDSKENPPSPVHPTRAKKASNDAFGDGRVDVENGSMEHDAWKRKERDD